MNASSIIAFFTYMLRHMLYVFRKELFADFKLALDIKKHTIHFSSHSYSQLYKDHSYMSHDMRFPTMWYGQPAKPQISLRIRAV